MRCVVFFHIVTRVLLFVACRHVLGGPFSMGFVHVPVLYSSPGVCVGPGGVVAVGPAPLPGVPLIGAGLVALVIIGE